jgi:hypothetical protein
MKPTVASNLAAIDSAKVVTSVAIEQNKNSCYSIRKSSVLDTKPSKQRLWSIFFGSIWFHGIASFQMILYDGQFFYQTKQNHNKGLKLHCMELQSSSYIFVWILSEKVFWCGCIECIYADVWFNIIFFVY